MTHLGMLEGEIVREPNPRHLVGNGRIEDAILTDAAGFLLSEVGPLDRVRRGDLLGRVLGLAGEVLQEIRADADGVVIFCRACPSTNVGGLAYLLDQDVD